jgi:hypothetical protein
MTIIAGCISPSFGIKALHINGVFPPTPYCSLTPVAQTLVVGAALRVGNEISVVTTVIITKAIRLRLTN